jgi:membrane dipeptidase
MNRRRFVGALGTGAVGAHALGLLRPGTASGETAGEDAEAIYARSFAVDAQCFGAAPPRTYVPYLTPDKIAALRTSGITLLAMCMTVANDPAIASEFLAVKDTVEKWDGFVAAHPDVFLKVTSGAGVDEAKRSGRVGFVYNFQNTTPFGWDLRKLATFVELGVRQIQLSHDRRNYVADSGRELTDAGLSRYGFEVVEALNERRVLVDLSHVGERSGLDAILASRSPVVFSHSGCWALCPHPRNVSDRNIRVMADRGGVFCVFDQTAWLTRDPEVSIDTYLAHVEHVIDVGGEDHVGVGTDQDAVDMTAMRPDEVERHQAAFDRDVEFHPQLTWKVRHMRVPELSHPKRLLHLARALQKRGHAARTIEKVLGGNYVRVFKEVVG